jgi:hypothetical protein
MWDAHPLTEGKTHHPRTKITGQARWYTSLIPVTREANDCSLRSTGQKCETLSKTNESKKNLKAKMFEGVAQVVEQGPEFNLLYLK